MHPALMAAVATERHAELLRTAAQHRRIRLARAARPARAVQLGPSAGRMLRDRWQQLAALVPGRAHEPCCA